MNLRLLQIGRADRHSAHGIAGARVDRIAQAARCNNNLIYIYFTDKDVVRHRLVQMIIRAYEEHSKKGFEVTP